MFYGVDRFSEKYPSLSPYQYAANNPLIFIDVNGDSLRAGQVNAQSMIRNTLTKEDAAYVQFNNEGTINNKLLNSHSSESGNFASLKELVNSDIVTEVRLDDKFEYKDENGNVKNNAMGEITTDEFFKDSKFGARTGESGFGGVTQTPGNESNKYNSTSDNVIITVNKNLSKQGRATLFSHEAYGHGVMYVQGKVHTHQVRNVNGAFIETNQELKIRIVTSINETIVNMKASGKW